MAHSDWNAITVLTTTRRRPMTLRSSRIDFQLEPPLLRLSPEASSIGTVVIRYQGKSLRVTGRERTLADGFRRPGDFGGLGELLESASGFPSLNLNLLKRILHVYDQRVVWAGVGWFLEKRKREFHVSESYLCELERHRPKSPIYVPRGLRGVGGILAARWNLVLPAEVMAAGGSIAG